MTAALKWLFAALFFALAVVSALVYSPDWSLVRMLTVAGLLTAACIWAYNALRFGSDPR